MKRLNMDTADARPALRLRRRAGAFTLMETIISILVIGVIVVTSMNTVGAAKMAEYRHTAQSRGLLLAQDLMTEILQHPYQDPVDGSGMGPGSSEAATGNRSLFNDVDDYNDWSASPPQYASGAAITWAHGYRRQVSVTWLNAGNLGTAASVESGIKMITVTVIKNDQVLVELKATRTNAWKDPLGG